LLLPGLGEQAVRKWIIATIVIAVVVCVGFGGRYLFQLLSENTAEVTMLANTTFGSLTKSWDVDSLAAASTPDFAARLNSDTAAWKAYAALGPAETVKPCTLDGLNITNGYGNARAECTATFATGAAVFIVDMESRPFRDWRVSGIQLKG
jgi:hypothetical protein